MNGDILKLGFSHSSVGKESSCNAGDPGSIPGLGRYPRERKGKKKKKENAGKYSNILAQRIPWTI